MDDPPQVRGGPERIFLLSVLADDRPFVILVKVLLFAVLTDLAFLGLKPRTELAVMLSFTVLTEFVSSCHDSFLS
jgi:hypothetical protein